MKNKIIIILVIILILIMALLIVRTTKAYGRMILHLYKQDLTELAENVLNTGVETRWHDMRVRYEVTQFGSVRRVIFESMNFGIAPSSDIKGLYYSPDNTIITGYLPYFPSDNGVGYFAEENNGDNRFYTEPLDENWFWFTEHY